MDLFYYFFLHFLLVVFISLPIISVSLLSIFNTVNLKDLPGKYNVCASSELVLSIYYFHVNGPYFPISFLCFVKTEHFEYFNVVTLESNSLGNQILAQDLLLLFMAEVASLVLKIIFAKTTVLLLCGH